MAMKPRAAILIPAALPLVLYHLTNGGFLGVVMPFFVPYFQTLSLSMSQASLLLSIGPLLSIFAPALWGSWADRTGQLARVLRIASFGALCAFAVLLMTREFVVLLAAIALYEFFNSGKAPVLDALVLQRISTTGGSYSHIRVFTSLALMISTALIGFVVPIGPALMMVGLGFLVVNLAISTRLRGRTGGVPREAGREHRQKALTGTLSILRYPGFAVLLTVGCLHAIASGPFDMTFYSRVLASGMPAYVPGLAQGIGVAAEVGIMLAYPLLAGRFSPRQLVAASFLASAIRWTLLPHADTTAAVLAQSLFHAFTYGTFFLAGTDFIFQRVPAHLRATGQGLFFSLSYGLGGFLGNSLSGVGYETFGAGIYYAAAALELAALTVVIALRRAPTRAAIETAGAPA